MGEMMIFYVILIVLTVCNILYLLYSLLLANRFTNIYIESIYPIVLGIISITSFPSNYIIEKSIGYIFLSLGIIPLLFKIFNKYIDNRYKNIIILLSIMGSMILIFSR